MFGLILVKEKRHRPGGRDGSLAHAVAQEIGWIALTDPLRSKRPPQAVDLHRAEKIRERHIIVQHILADHQVPMGFRTMGHAPFV
jgi:hypothetical protein